MKRFLRLETLYYTLLILSGLFASFIFIAPLIIDSGNGFLTGAGATFYRVGAFFCAQVPERSFHLGTTQLPVDARMTGIFVSGFLGLMMPAIKRPRRASWIYLIIGLIMAIPLVIDGTTQTILVWRESNNILRLATGLLAGGGVAYALGAILLEDTEITGFWQGLVLPPAHAALVIALTVSLIFAGVGGYFGRQIMTRQEAAGAIGSSLGKNASQRFVYWLPPNSGISTAHNSYAARYNDAVLNDLRQVGIVKSTLGVWVIAVVKKAPSSSAGFLGETPGKLSYIDAVSGRVILRTTH